MGVGSILSGISSSMRKKRLDRFFNGIEDARKSFGEFLSAFEIEDASNGNYFEALGILPTKDLKIIKDAYRNIIKRYHPDVSKSPDADAITKRANEAYEHLEKLKDQRAKSAKERLNPMMNALAREYNRLMERDYRKLEDEFSHGPVEKWFYIQELDAFLDYKKRLDRSYRNVFGVFFSMCKKMRRLDAEGKRLSKTSSRETAERLQSSLDLLRDMEEQCKHVNDDISEIRKEFYNAARENSNKLRAKLAH
ncbi:MAG: DnaJ domain-containing protein [Candidatus Micrarchaeaceae archaeon]